MELPLNHRSVPALAIAAAGASCCSCTGCSRLRRWRVASASNWAARLMPGERGERRQRFAKVAWIRLARARSWVYPGVMTTAR